MRYELQVPGEKHQTLKTLKNRNLYLHTAQGRQIEGSGFNCTILLKPYTTREETKKRKPKLMCYISIKIMDLQVET